MESLTPAENLMNSILMDEVKHRWEPGHMAQRAAKRCGVSSKRLLLMMRKKNKLILKEKAK